MTEHKVDFLAFSSARGRVLSEFTESNGIGTLSEKSLHKILKLYVEPDENKHEQALYGKIADVKNSFGIYEIQTRNADKLAAKLSIFLKNDKVTLVLPLAAEKTVRWIDKETGEISKPVKSPKKENVFYALRELYKIRRFLKDDNLKIRLIYLVCEEYRYLNGWDKTKKRGSTRMERIPCEIIREAEISSLEDYCEIVPDNLPKEFTLKEFVSISGCNKRIASYVISTLAYVGAISHVGKRGREYLYSKTS